ncbi:MAG: hypothetical protein H6686_04345 [Fibrobacteria bacterium]|nr:hypothetical protein [Fibrobacteria bacterium]
MAYTWERASTENLFDAVRKQPLDFDSWLLLTFDDASVDSWQQPRTALWFTGPEEGAMFLAERLVPLWVPPGDESATTALVSEISKLRASRKLKVKDLEAWRKGFNKVAGTRGQILWYGPFDDFQRGEGDVSDLAQDLEFWLGENELSLSDLNPGEPKHQRILADFFIQLGV